MLVHINAYDSQNVNQVIRDDIKIEIPIISDCIIVNLIANSVVKLKDCHRYHRVNTKDKFLKIKQLQSY